MPYASDYTHNMETIIVVQFWRMTHTSDHLQPPPSPSTTVATDQHSLMANKKRQKKQACHDPIPKTQHHASKHTRCTIVES